MKKFMRGFTLIMLDELKNDIENGANVYVDDLHHEIYNTSYSINSTKVAREKLLEYGVFEAIKKVVDYEKASFGEVLTDITEPKNLANMLIYILGEEFIYSTDVYSIGGNLVTNEHIDHLTESIKKEILNDL